MCLYLKSFTPKYTIKDKIVYKWLINNNGVIISPFQEFVYNLGEVHTSLLVRSCGWYSLAAAGFLMQNAKFPPKIISSPRSRPIPHSFNKFYITHFVPAVAIIKDEVDLGLHTLDSIRSALEYKQFHTNLDRTFFNVFLYECTIPKHSWYYEGRNGEIASDQLIVNKVVLKIYSP